MWWLLACKDPSSVTVVTDTPPTEPTHSTSHTGTVQVPTADTGAEPLLDDCDPELRPPGPSKIVDPHQDVLGALPTPTGVHLSMPGSDPSVSVAVVWRTDLDTLASVVELGPVGGAVTRHETGSFRYGGLAEGDYRVHEFKVCGGLTPGTRYQYRVGGDGAFSPWYEFATPRADLSSLRVGFAGDSRGSYLQWSLVLQGLASSSPDLFLFAGDLVSSGISQSEWDLWFRAGEGVIERRLLLPAHGNHEFLAPHWFAQFSLPGNELWYQFRQGPLHLVVLNDTAFGTEMADQAAYVEEVLGPSDATWKVVMQHQSAYASCSRHGSNLTVRDLWVPVFERAGVDFVIGGHNHVYERSVPMLGGVEVDPASGITFLVTGGAGAPLYPGFDNEPFNAVAAAVEHAGIVDLTATEATFEVRDATGAVIDAFVLPAD